VFSTAISLIDPDIPQCHILLSMSTFFLVVALVILQAR